MSVRDLLEKLAKGEVDLEVVVESLARKPFEDLGELQIDAHRELRQGVAEVVFGEGKTPAQIIVAGKALVEAGQNLLVTRLSAEAVPAVQIGLPGLTYDPASRIGQVRTRQVVVRAIPPVAVVTGGTSDVPVAEEAAQTLDALGVPVVRLYDVGVAGIHRLLARVDALRDASAVIAIAGMEGALPSVVGGLVACPVVAVPTSIGYGTSLGGLTELFAMLTSLASGISVVNIDNGFSAALAVHRMLHALRPSESRGA
jgi:NCAIR mutase (PurE)-related protein